MCHMVYSSSVSRVFINHRDMLIGYKYFTVRDGMLWPICFPEFRYITEWTSESRLRVRDWPRTQPVHFRIRTDNGRKVCGAGKIKGGLHINPFDDRSTEDWWISHTSRPIPVLFNIDDTVFYDGDHVSVRQFEIDFCLSNPRTDQLGMREHLRILNGMLTKRQ